MARSGNQTYRYATPQPFAVPVIEARAQVFDDPALQAIAQLLPFDIFPHQQLLYSGPIIENIMFNLNREYEFRTGIKNREWKAYKSGKDDFDTFVPNGHADGYLKKSTLEKYPMYWFPLYIKDMQEFIVNNFMGSATIPDDLGSAMARIFGNATTNPQGWNGKTVIRPYYILPRAMDDGSDNNTTRFNVDLSGTDFPFPWDSQAVANAGARLGIGIEGKAYVHRGETGIITSDEQWPRSVIGKERTEQDVTIKEGQLIEQDGSTVKGIDGVHVPMKAEGRPEQERKISEENAPLPGAIGKADPESGYGFFGHLPYVLQQCRFQPPIIETFSATSPIKDYVSNVYSNQTPNLPWYFSQEVERQHHADWGGWIIQGLGGLNGNGVQAMAYANPQHSDPVTNCPYQVFYPAPSSNCSCIDGVAAYAIWTSSYESLHWNMRDWFNYGRSAGIKYFGPKTRLRIRGDVSLGAGVGGTAGFFVGVRTIRVGTNNLQPFVPIIGRGSFAEEALGSNDVNIMQAMKKHYPYYEVDGLDGILSIEIYCETTTDVRQVVLARDGAGGSYIPATDLGCLVGTSSFNIDYVQLYEPSLTHGDSRMPAQDSVTLQPPPEYDYPELG
jgi:hypothetical protein